MKVDLFFVDRYGWNHRAGNPSKTTIKKLLVEAWTEGKATELRVHVFHRRSLTV